MEAFFGEFWAEVVALADRVNDMDIEDGAGEIVLRILKGADDRLAVAQISGKRDLLNAVAVLLNPRDGRVRLGSEDADLVLSALRLLAVGYYRSLMVEERFRVGRLECQREAMRRFEGRLLGRGGEANPPGPH